MMIVDVSVLSKDSIKIKGRNSSFVIDPEVKIQKVSADAVIFLKDTAARPPTTYSSSWRANRERRNLLIWRPLIS